MTLGRSRIPRRAFLRGALAAAAAAAGGSACAGQQRPVSAATPGGGVLPDIPRVAPQLEALVARPPSACPAGASPLRSFFLGGFECSTHSYPGGRRLDMTAATRHDVFARQDYGRLHSVNIRSARDGVSWVLSEPSAGRYDFSRAIAMLEAAQAADVQVIWDLMHFGWPSHVDVFDTSFATRFAAYARAFAVVLREHGGAERPPIVSPINEISFLSWAGGDRGIINPFALERASELKVQLVRAAIAAMHAMREVSPDTQFMHCDPIVHVASYADELLPNETAETLRSLQFQAWDMITGRTWKQLGGSPKLMNIVGVNYYRDNQRFLDGQIMHGTDKRHRPVSQMLEEVARRYETPVVIAETGAEGDDRRVWLRYIAGEAVKAMQAGCPLLGITWYPIVNHPGWLDDRHTQNGLWDYADDSGVRPIHRPLADELARLEEPLARLSACAALHRAGAARAL